MVTTTDLSKFNMREIALLRDISDAWLKDGLPEDFELYDVLPMLNIDSGKVVLTNDAGEVVAINEETGKLESFYVTPYEGMEGFFDELLENYASAGEEDREYIRNIAERRNITVDWSIYYKQNGGE